MFYHNCCFVLFQLLGKSTVNPLINLHIPLRILWGNLGAEKWQHLFAPLRISLWNLDRWIVIYESNSSSFLQMIYLLINKWYLVSTYLHTKLLKIRHACLDQGFFIYYKLAAAAAAGTSLPQLMVSGTYRRRCYRTKNDFCHK